MTKDFPTQTASQDLSSLRWQWDKESVPSNRLLGWVRRDARAWALAVAGQRNFRRTNRPWALGEGAVWFKPHIALSASKTFSSCIYLLVPWQQMRMGRNFRIYANHPLVSPSHFSFRFTCFSIVKPNGAPPIFSAITCCLARFAAVWYRQDHGFHAGFSAGFRGPQSQPNLRAHPDLQRAPAVPWYGCELHILHQWAKAGQYIAHGSDRGCQHPQDKLLLLCFSICSSFKTL